LGHELEIFNFDFEKIAIAKFYSKKLISLNTDFENLILTIKMIVALTKKQTDIFLTL